MAIRTSFGVWYTEKKNGEVGDVRLYHISEEESIQVFSPRIPARPELDRQTGLVWAVDEERLFMFLTPRNCPRIAYHVHENTTQADQRRFFATESARRGIVIERAWLAAMQSIVLYLYEFDPKAFTVQDANAGYYVAKTAQKPIFKRRIDDVLYELRRLNVEMQIVDNLWETADRVQNSTLGWSLCRMAYAQPRKPA